MAEAEVLDVGYSSCRLCGLRGGAVQIFGETGLHKTITKYLPIHVVIADSLPETVCHSCVQILTNWHQFVLACCQTDSILRSAPPESQDRKIGYESANPCLVLSKNKVYSGSDDEPLQRKAIDSSEKAQRDVSCSEDDSTFINDSGTPKDKYRCGMCSDTFKFKSALTNHVRFCVAKDKFSCDICGLFYKSLVNLMKHMEKEHNSSLEKCKECDSYVRGSKMRQHMKLVHDVKSKEYKGQRSMSCKYCHIQFFNKYQWAEHSKKHRFDFVHCQQCEFSGKRYTVRRHTRIRHTTRIFACSMCPQTFSIQSLLKDHLTSHSNERRYTCDVCGDSFKRLNHVKEHVQSHQDNNLQCKICGKFFQRKRYLAMHEKTVHNFYADGSAPKSKGFQCKVCGTQIKWKKNLIMHMRTHTSESEELVAQVVRAHTVK